MWRAFDEVLHRDVIAKIHTSTDPEVSARFRRASLDAAALNHSNVARIYDTGEDKGRPWFVMEFLEGGMLADGAAPTSPPSIADLGVSVCAALAHSHSVGIVHGSIKDSNIGFTESGFIKVADFGTSEIALQTNPPPATDLRDLGILLYRLATGHEPAIPLRNPRDLKPELPPPLSRAIMTALSDPGFASAREFEAALKAIFEDTAPQAARRRARGRPKAQMAAAPRQSFLRTEGRWLVPVILIVAVAGGLVASLPALRAKLSEIVGVGDSVPAAAPVKATPGGVYDPPPGDGTENNAALRLAFDQDLDTSWHTSTYRTESFGKLKKGVGIYADFGTPVSIGGLRVVSEVGGWSATVRYSEDASSWSEAGQAQEAAADQIFPTQGTHRYFMIWITGLVKAPESKGKNPYSVAVLEISAVAR